MTTMKSLISASSLLLVFLNLPVVGQSAMDDDIKMPEKFSTRTPPDLLIENFLVDSFEASGKIISSYRPARYLYNGDSVYLQMNMPVSVGDRFIIFNDRGGAKVPGSIFSKKGHWIHVKGYVQIVKVTNSTVVGELYDTTEDIGVGDSLAPWMNLQVAVTMQEPENDIRGRIMESATGMYMIGAYDFVFLDKGEKDGVKKGDRFFVYRTGDGNQNVVPGHPEVNIAELIVVQTSPSFATAYVQGASQTFHAGATFKAARAEATYLE